MTEAATNKRGLVTDEHRAEAARLMEIWTRVRAKRREAGEPFTQDWFGETYGIGNQSAVGFFLNGKTALSLKAARGFAAGLGCKVSDFSPRLAKIIEGPALSPQAMEIAAICDALPTSEDRDWLVDAVLIALATRERRRSAQDARDARATAHAAGHEPTAVQQSDPGRQHETSRG